MRHFSSVILGCSSTFILPALVPVLIKRPGLCLNLIGKLAKPVQLVGQSVQVGIGPPSWLGPGLSLPEEPGDHLFRSSTPKRSRGLDSGERAAGKIGAASSRQAQSQGLLAILCALNEPAARE